MRETSMHGVQSASTGGERAERPDPGLARGLWEAPRWAFVVVLALVALVAVAWTGRLAARHVRRKAGR
jgi:uncharacterized protein involved in exopolysaccharide biosynthesis